MDDHPQTTLLPPQKNRNPLAWKALGLLVVFTLGVISGFFLRDYVVQLQAQRAEEAANQALAELIREVNPPEGYTLPVQYNDLGPQLVAAGVINPKTFARALQQGGHPLSPEQETILRKGSTTQIVLNKENAHFLLDFFWALGLANRNALLTEGPMMQAGEGQIGRFASTGGWTIGDRPATEVYSRLDLVPLTPEQQARLEEVAFAVFRPCCNNPTAFPDCNHGMAMLGMLELLAAQDATVDEMFEAARYANAFWFPNQSLELALLFQEAKEMSFSEVDARVVVGPNLSSASGYQQVHQYLVSKGVFPQAPGSSSSCGA